MERQQQAYISKWRYEADFSYWLKMATWTSDEGAALIHGLEPRRIKIPYPNSTRELFPIIKSWLECREHAVCALRAGQLKESSKPVEFLRWAESLGYPIHEGLQRLFGESQAKTKPVKLPLTWKVTARTLAEVVLKKHPLWSITQISEQVHKIMREKHVPGEQGMTGYGNKVPTAETIRRHALTGLRATRH
jgi:hypothetical protein